MGRKNFTIYTFHPLLFTQTSFALNKNLYNNNWVHREMYDLDVFHI